MEDLEREIVEIATKLGALAPDLKAAAELRIDFASMKKETEMFRREHDKEMEAMEDRMADGDKKFRELELRVQACEQQAKNMERAIEEKIKVLQKELDEKIKALQDSQAGVGKRVWEVVQLILSAIFGGAVAYFSAKRGP